MQRRFILALALLLPFGAHAHEGENIYGGIEFRIGDGFTVSQPQQTYYMLHTDDGQTLYIELTPELLKKLGGRRGLLHHKRLRLKRLQSVLGMSLQGDGRTASN